MPFADRFAEVAPAYAAHRPAYPAALFAGLASLAPSRRLAWDCASGNGQAARMLEPHFRAVAASDGSLAQLVMPPRSGRGLLLVALAEACALAPRSVDLVVVAQALHWLDADPFYSEVRRVARPGAALAAITYGLCSVDAAVDRVVRRFYDGILGPFWAPERRHVDAAYRTLPFPFQRLEMRAPPMTARWDLGGLLAFLGTWSAVAGFRRTLGSDPLEHVAGELAAAWGPSAARRTVTWPLTVLAGRIE